MKKIYLLMAFGFVALTGCDKDEALERADYVSFEAKEYIFRVEENATTTKDIKVYATQTSGSDRTYNIMVDEDATDLTVGYTVPSTVTIPANTNVGSFPVSITDDASMQYVAQTLVVDFQDTDGLNSSELISFNVAELCPDTIVKLSLTFDAYAEEAYWEIYDLSGTPTVIMSGGEGGAYDANDNSTISMENCMASGSYGIVVYDTYGDAGTTFTISAGGVTLASGATPDAGGGYPTLTQISETFTID